MNDVPRPESEAPIVSTAPLKPASVATVPWWKNNLSVLIALLAFVLSLLTSLISAYTAHKKDVHDQQAELSAVVQKILQIPLARVSLLGSIKTSGAGNLETFFVEQHRMLTAAAYDLARRLGSNAPAPELLTIAPMLASFENYRAAKQIWRQATLAADNFSDEVSALRAYGMGMVQFAQNDRERTEGEQAFEAAMNIGSKYPDVARNPAEISYAHALTQIAWPVGRVNAGCRSPEGLQVAGST